MRDTELLVIGGGPAGLGAALAAASLGVNVLLCEQRPELGGALRQQTHKFFHSEATFGGLRGDQVAQQLIESVEKNKKIEVWSSCSVTGFYADGIVTCMHDEKYVKLCPERVLLATGASEQMLSFYGNDLPGVMSAGAAQSLMNRYGVRPARRAVIVGSGNMGLQVAYQLLQAGVEVAAVIDIAPEIKGYQVYASMLQRAGVALLCETKLLQAIGKNGVSGVKVAKVDEAGQVLPGTEEIIDCDTVCLSVGLSPLAELCALAGCRLRFTAGDFTLAPDVDASFETSVVGVFAAGSIIGVKDAYLAWLEGQIAGMEAAVSLGKGNENLADRQVPLRNEWEALCAFSENAPEKGGLA